MAQMKASIMLMKNWILFCGNIHLRIKISKHAVWEVLMVWNRLKRESEKEREVEFRLLIYLELSVQTVRNHMQLYPNPLWALISHEKWSYTVGTGVQMDRDVEFFKTVFAKSVFSIYPGLQITSLDLDSSFRWGLFSKPPSHAIWLWGSDRSECNRGT